MLSQGIKKTMELPLNKIINGDCKQVLKTLEDNSIDSIVTCNT